MMLVIGFCCKCFGFTFLCAMCFDFGLFMSNWIMKMNKLSRLKVRGIVKLMKGGLEV